MQARYDADQAEENNHTQNCVSNLDPLDAKLFTEKTAGRQNHEDDHPKVEGIEAAGEKLDRSEQVLGKGKDREPDRKQLIEVKNQPEGFGEFLKENGEGFLTARVAARHDVGQKTEEHEPRRIRDGKAKQAGEAEHEGHLNAEKQAQAPHPSQSHGVAPEKFVDAS